MLALEQACNRPHRTFHSAMLGPMQEEFRGENFDYSFALAYELISQLRQTSSKAGAVHCMINSPSWLARGDRERCVSIADPRDEINTFQRIKPGQLAIVEMKLPSLRLQDSACMARLQFRSRFPHGNQSRYFLQFRYLFTFKCYLNN